MDFLVAIMKILYIFLGVKQVNKGLFSLLHRNIILTKINGKNCHKCHDKELIQRLFCVKIIKYLLLEELIVFIKVSLK